MDENDVEILLREDLYRGFFRVEGVRLRHRRFAGDWTPPLTRELFARREVTCVLPYDPVADRVVLLEQFRVGALDRPGSPWLLELVAGINEPGEAPDDVARREAREEAGIELGELEPVCRYLVSPGGTNERVHLFCARVDATTANGVHGLEEENEDILVHSLPVDEALAALASGRIDNAASIIALQWLALNRAALRERWSSGPGSEAP